MQIFQNKVLRNIINAAWYEYNADLHLDLGIPTVKKEIKREGKHEAKLNLFENIEALQLLQLPCL